MKLATWNCFRRACILLIVGLLAMAPPVWAQELQLVFGLYTTDKPTALVKAYRPILTAIETELSESLGIPVTVRTNISPSYEAGVDALLSGDVDFARLGPASYIAATKQSPGLRILALTSKDGAQTNRGVICVHEDSEYASIADLAGARFAFGNEESTIGRYLSQAYLMKHGITSNELKYFDYLVRHDRVGHAVANRSFDAGALKEGTFRKLVNKGLPLRALAKFENVNIPWVAEAGMDDRLFQALRKIMLELSAPAAFETMGQKQFVAATDNDFSEVRDSITRNKDFFKGAAALNTAATD